MMFLRTVLHPSLALVAACLLTLTACSSDDGETTGGSGTDVTSGSDAAQTDAHDDHDGDDHDGEDHDEDTGETDGELAEVCGHATNGPFVDITVGDGAAPDATNEHALVRLTLPAVPSEAGFAGAVTWKADEEGDFEIFLTKEVVFTVTDASGGEVEIEASEPIVSGCDALAIVHTVELGIGTYTFHFAGNEMEVGLVVEHAGEGHDHE